MAKQSINIGSAANMEPEVRSEQLLIYVTIILQNYMMVVEDYYIK